MLSFYVEGQYGCSCLGPVWLFVHTTCWVFHWAAGCRTLDTWQQNSSVWAWTWTRWLCTVCAITILPLPSFLLTSTYRAAASGTAYQMLPLVRFTAARVLLSFREQKLPQNNLTFTRSLIKSALTSSSGRLADSWPLAGMWNQALDVIP